MSTKRIAGSPNTFAINGIAYGCAADADIGSKLSRFEKENIMNSGLPMQKRILIDRTKGPFKLIVDDDEAAQIAVECDSTDMKKFLYTNAAGVQYHCKGDFSMGEYMSAENSLEVTVSPLETNDWQMVK